MLGLLALLFFMSLGWITQHGSYMKVPDVTGMETLKAIDQLEKEGFEVLISDSAYNDDLPLNTVKKQLPFAGATVKVNRRVFLQINPTQLPQISMPDLKGMSYRFAVENLKKFNLIAGDTIEKPDFMKGAILDQLYNGQPIQPGQTIRWGSKITLVVGGGVNAVDIPVPQLIGMTVAQVRELLSSQGILLASIIGSDDSFDTDNGFVYRQNPPASDEEGQRSYIRPGQTMDIWIRKDKPVTDSESINQLQENNRQESRPGSDY